MRETNPSKLADGKFVRFTVPTLRQIEAIAASEKRTISNTVRILVEEALARRGKRKAA